MLQSIQKACKTLFENIWWKNSRFDTKQCFKFFDFNEISIKMVAGKNLFYLFVFLFVKI